MKLLVFVHGYPPEQNAGAEWMIHEMVKSWIKFGHEVRVLSNYAGTFQGVRVEKLDISPGILMSNFQWADMVVSHLNMANLAYNKCRAMGKKFMFVVHNTHRYHYCNHDKVFVVQNAEWARATLNYSRPTIVVNPPVNYRDWSESNRGEYITLVNYNELKGGATLREIARSMPHRKFMAVRGHYGTMVENMPNNVVKVDNTPDMQSIYDQSRIILMPSDYESWGRVATEAMACGLPVIASPTPGLRENLSYAGTFRLRDNISGWISAINEFDDKSRYLSIRELGYQRVRELDPVPQLERLNDFIHAIESGHIT
jgi:glycosyltransferase involved in cell wall biosynthesis